MLISASIFTRPKRAQHLYNNLRTTNLYASHPEVAERLLKRLEADVTRGRSTAGTALHNDVENIVLWKSGK